MNLLLWLWVWLLASKGVAGLIQYQTCWNILGCSELGAGKRHDIGSPQKDSSPLSPVITWHFSQTWGAGSRLINFHVWYLTSSSGQFCKGTWEILFSNDVWHGISLLIFSRTWPSLHQELNTHSLSWSWADLWLNYSPEKTSKVTEHDFQGDTLLSHW